MLPVPKEHLEIFERRKTMYCDSDLSGNSEERAVLKKLLCGGVYEIRYEKSGEEILTLAPFIGVRKSFKGELSCQFRIIATDEERIGSIIFWYEINELKSIRSVDELEMPLYISLGRHSNLFRDLLANNLITPVMAVADTPPPRNDEEYL